MTNALVTTLENQQLGDMETKILSIYAEHGIVVPTDLVKIYNETYALEKGVRKIRVTDVSRALKKIKRLVLDSALPELRQLIMEEQFMLYNEALLAWFRSKEDITVTTEKEEHGDTQKFSTTTKTMPMIGDPRHWNNAANALKQLREMEGLDSPKKISLILEQEMKLILEYLEANASEETYNEVISLFSNYRSTGGEMIVDSEEVEILD